MKHLRNDEAGVSVMEFGLIAPVLMMMLMGVFDIGHGLYVRSVLNGALFEAARGSSLEGAGASSQQSVIDGKLRSTIKRVSPLATVDIKRRYYKTFSEAAAAKAEDIVDDANNNKICDVGESFIDKNLNDKWDKDGGNAGQGDARDVVIIQAQVSYERLFPVSKLIGLPSSVQMISDSILANQPYAQKTAYGTPVTRDCPAFVPDP